MPLRAFHIYSGAGGNLLAAGMSFQALFASFAAVWIGFSFVGVFLSGRPELREAIIVFINSQIPNLITPGGPIDPALIEGSLGFGWTGWIAIVVVLYTTINWLGYVRTAIRTIFGLPLAPVNAFFLKLYDLLLALVFGLIVLISSALAVFATNLAGVVLPLLGVTSGWGDVWIEAISLVVVFIFDMGLLAALMRILSGVPIPLKNIRGGVLLGGAALSLLKIAASLALTKTSDNPLLASFAVFVGVLVYFNLASRIYLLATSWVAASMQQDGVEVHDLGWVVPHRHSSS